VQFYFNCENKNNVAAERIVIEAEISKYFFWQLKGIFSVKETINIQYAPLDNQLSLSTSKIEPSQVINGKAKWVLYSDKPVNVLPPFGTSVVMNPGDSLYITYQSDEPVYAGKNVPVMELLNAMTRTNKLLVTPQRKNSYNANTLQDYMEWNKYLDDKLMLQLPIIDSYNKKISRNEYEYYKQHFITDVENNRLNAFTALSDAVQKGYEGLSLSDLNFIWDSTQCKPWRLWLQSLPYYSGSINTFHEYNRMSVWRRFGFNLHNDSLQNKEKRTYLYYTSAKQKYTGLLRERLMAFILDEQTITELGIKNPMTQLMLKDYYSQPGFPEYKKWVKQLEEKAK
jgi:hypothetical protein